MPRDKRLYMTFPIDIHRHPKLQRLSPEQKWAWLMSIAALIDETDIPPASQETHDELVRAGLWSADGSPVASELWAMWKRTRSPIPRALRKAVFARDGRVCAGCGSTVDLQLDHVFPWSLGGAHTFDNLRVLCGPCNRSKGATVL